MENEQDEALDKQFDGQVFDSEISDLGNLVNIMLDYYSFSRNSVEDGEEWKKGTTHEQKIMPEDIDELIGEAFKTQLKKFIKK